jgi:phosphotransferase system HPr (HPr) family protein
LHARSAARLARLAMSAAGGVWLQRGDASADATSIIDLLTLGCPQGTRVTLMVEQDADLPLLDSLAALVESGFGE